MTHTLLMAVNKFQLRLKPLHQNILQTHRLSPPDGEISPFWFISSCLPVSANNLPTFKDFSDAPRQSSSSQIFCSTPTCFVFCDCFSKKFFLKAVFYLTQNTVEQRKKSLIFRRLGDKATIIFFCCFTLNLKIE